jgi:hypothetical protein
MNEKNTRYIQPEFNEKEKYLYSVMKTIAGIMVKKYKIAIYHKPSLPIIDVYNKVKSVDQEVAQGIESVFYTKNGNQRTINPDGGLLFARDMNGERILLLAAELKQQGRIKTTKSIGNAIDRVSSDINSLEDFVLIKYKRDKVIFPFIIFCYGSDFDDDYTKTKQYRHNNYHRLNVFNFKNASYFYMKNDFDKKYVYTTIEQCLEMSIKWYIDKYGRENFIPSV